ncbi:MAG TPA: cupin domain-containing protein [Gemmatimonadaceae bacterium]
MTTPTSIATAERYSWGARCDGWHLVRAPGLSVIQERMPPGTAEVRHRHARARQFFYVLAGRLTLEVEGTRHVLDAGTGLEIAPGDAHQALNESERPVEFLVISQPPSHGDREAAPMGG